MTHLPALEVLIERWRVIIDDVRWAVRMFHARRHRRQLGFSSRIAFDNALRPKLDAPNVIAYPDAFYHTKPADHERAISAGGLVRDLRSLTKLEG